MADDRALEAGGVLSAEDYLRSLPQDQLGPAARMLLSYPRPPRQSAGVLTPGSLRSIAGEVADGERSAQLPFLHVASED